MSLNGLFPPFITLFEVTESAGIVKSADFFSYADDTADTFDGNHERRIR